MVDTPILHYRHHLIQMVLANEYPNAILTSIPVIVLPSQEKICLLTKVSFKVRLILASLPLECLPHVRDKASEAPSVARFPHRPTKTRHLFRQIGDLPTYIFPPCLNHSIRKAVLHAKWQFVLNPKCQEQLSNCISWQFQIFTGIQMQLWKWEVDLTLPLHIRPELLVKLVKLANPWGFGTYVHVLSN